MRNRRAVEALRTRIDQHIERGEVDGYGITVREAKLLCNVIDALRAVLDKARRPCTPEKDQ